MTVTVLLLVAAVPFALLVFLRLTGIDGNRHTAAALALSPYAAVAGMLLGGLALVVRQWWIGAVVLALTVALVAVLLPRMLPDGQPANDGAVLRVLATNLYFSNGDAQRVVDHVRDNQIDVLALSELDSSGVAALADAGLFSVPPHQALRAADYGSGSGLVSRYPLEELPPVEPSTFEQPRALLHLPGGATAEIVAVHACPPTLDVDDWRTELAALPQADDAAVRILAGDFNATLDHAALRRVLSAGYHDAAEQRGNGFLPTWPSGLYPPPVTIDHVLADQRVEVRDYRVLNVPGSDHDAVYAELALPG
ncbi:Metal-dependent hydrolase, endonuclease/exonuclease/phosphatase family [Amycolatopsis marina]|uniref:Metal-dependent hydrolase, endonuclease/exonuclease/phosphatase family n=2 Tax=Amycolatopsis marina TaxID=490629 RepID=A0A1I0Y5D7_9PSEU|nr:Metal-dependent hydrolase, endonuclease/exonuclease/phosphatase family [Amycolatopsis marina]